MRCRNTVNTVAITDDITCSCEVGRTFRVSTGNTLSEWTMRETRTIDHTRFPRYELALLLTHNRPPVSGKQITQHQVNR